MNKVNQFKNKKVIILELEDELKSEIVNAVEVENSTRHEGKVSMAGWVRLACLEKLGIIKKGDEQSN
jgi:hypothetical protein